MTVVAAPAGRRQRRGRVYAPLEWVAFGALPVTWLIAFPWVRWYVNPDGISYLSLAERWLAGDVANAVNGYWAPLLSWVVAPFLAVGVPPLVAARLVLLLAAVAAQLALRRLAVAAGVSPRGRSVLLLAAVPLLVLMSSWGLYPDLLAVPLLLEAVHQLCRRQFARRTLPPVLAGLLAGLAFLAKAFVLPFAVALLGVACLLQLRAVARPSATRVLAATGLCLAVFGLVAGAWVAALSLKYGEVTVSTAADFNAELIGSRGHGFQFPGLYPLPYPEATSAWEVPSSVGVIEDTTLPRGLTADEEQLRERAEAVARNLLTATRTVVGRAAVAGVLALVAIPVLWPRRLRGLCDEDVVRLGVVGAGLLTLGGYTLLIVIERYLWLPLLALLVVAGLGLDRLPRRTWLVALVGTALVVSTSLGAWSRVATRWQLHREVHTAAAEVDPGRAFALADGDWSRALLLAYLTDGTYHGQTGPRPAPVLARELSEADIDTLVVLDEADRPPGLPPLAGAIEIYDVASDGLRRRVVVGRPEAGQAAKSRSASLARWARGEP